MGKFYVDDSIIVPRSVSVDFDGVISLTDDYPNVGLLDNNFVEYLKDWQKLGGVVILNTGRRRNNGTVQPALKALKEQCDFIPDYVNENIREGIRKYGDCRKIMADYYIDDRNISKKDFTNLVASETNTHHLIIDSSVYQSNLTYSTSKPEVTEDNKFKFYTDDLAATLLQKNRAYGNSFDREMDEWGLSALCIRISDKYSRLKNLVKNPNINVGDESLYDTLKDLAGYAILGLNYLNNKKDDSDE